MISTVAFFVVLAGINLSTGESTLVKINIPFTAIETCEGARPVLFEQAKIDLVGHVELLDSVCQRINSAKEQSI